MKYSSSLSVAHSTSEKQWSKKVTKRRRRSAAKDRKAIVITGTCAVSPISATSGPLVPIPTPHLSTPKAPLADACEGKSALTDSVPANDDSVACEKRAKIPDWAHTTDLGKVAAANRVLKATGSGYAFTLNLGPAEIAAANDNRKGFLDHFKRRIARAFNRVLGYQPDHLIAVGVAALDRLHLHGTIEANDNNVDAIKGALCRAGGVWDHPRGNEYQCDVQPLYDPDVWTNYILRDGPKARRLIAGRSVSIAGPLRRRARELWIGGGTSDA